MEQVKAITVAHGDGIGPEIMEATLHVLNEAKARLRIETIEVGKRVYEQGNTTGIPDSAWQSILNTKTLLKAPITTPQGGGYKSLNVTIRNTLDLYANIRPCVAYAPFVKTNHPKLDVVIVRENSEDLYSGIEHRQTADVYQSLKLISRPACEQIIRYAFEYAVQNGRKKVSCFSKDNIMKMTDGLFHKVFNEIGESYPQIEKDHHIIDIACAKLACKPEMFDIIVTSNLYGDIISDIAAEISGSVGLAGSANIGVDYAMFEAIHGSAPDIAGQDIANPSGLLQAAVQMLVHIGQIDVANTIQNAWLATIEDGYHTADIYDASKSKQKCGTKAFAKSVIEHLGATPKTFKPASFVPSQQLASRKTNTFTQAPNKQLVGVDVFLDFRDGNASKLAEKINAITNGRLKLQMITNKGLKCWPNVYSEHVTSDHWRGRFVPEGSNKQATHKDICDLMEALTAANFDFIKTEGLYTFDGELGFSLAQGE